MGEKRKGRKRQNREKKMDVGGKSRIKKREKIMAKKKWKVNTKMVGPMLTV